MDMISKNYENKVDIIKTYNLILNELIFKELKHYYI